MLFDSILTVFIVLVGGNLNNVSALGKNDAQLTAILSSPPLRTIRTHQASNNCEGFCCIIKKSLRCFTEGKSSKNSICAFLEIIPGCCKFSNCYKYTFITETCKTNWTITKCNKQNGQETKKEKNTNLTQESDMAFGALELERQQKSITIDVWCVDETSRSYRCGMIIIILRDS